MMDCSELLSKVPEDWYEIKDCWTVACKMVALQNGKDASLLDLNAYFYYNREDGEKYPDGFEGIVRKNISIAEDRETRKEIEQEYDFLHQFIGLNCTGLAYANPVQFNPINWCKKSYSCSISFLVSLSSAILIFLRTIPSKPSGYFSPSSRL